MLLIALNGCGGSPKVSAPIQHVFFVVLAAPDGTIIDNPAMPYWNQLAKRYGVQHVEAGSGPEIGNYFLMTAGADPTKGVVDPNSWMGSYSGEEIAKTLTRAGKTWKVYAQSIPSIGYVGEDSYPYLKRHNPFAYFSSVQNNVTQKNNIVPLIQLRADFEEEKLPSFSFIIPDNQHSGRDCPDGSSVCADAQRASATDQFLHDTVAPLLLNPSLLERSALVVTFDGKKGRRNEMSSLPLVILEPEGEGAQPLEQRYSFTSLMQFMLENLQISNSVDSNAKVPIKDQTDPGSTNSAIRNVSNFDPSNGMVAGPGTVAADLPDTAITAETPNAIRYVDRFPGPDATAKLRACIAALPSGGTCDARGFGASQQTITSSVTLGDGVHSYTLIFDPATAFVPTSDIDMFVQPPNTNVDGLHTDVSGLFGYSHSVIIFDGNRWTYPNPPGSGGSNNRNTSLSNFTVYGSGNTTGTAIYLHAANGSHGSITWVSINDIHINGMRYALRGDAEASSWLNANWITRLFAWGSVYGVYFDAKGGDVSSNHFDSYEFENGTSSINAIRLASSGTGVCASEDFTNLKIWDMADKNAIYIDDACQSNQFWGSAEGHVVTAAGDSGPYLQYNIGSVDGNYIYAPALYGAQVIAQGQDNWGLVRLETGDSVNSGLISWLKGDGKTRLGYLGYSSTDIPLTLQNGAKFIVNGGVTQLSGGMVPGNSTAPTCDSTRRGSFWYQPGGKGEKDVVEVCAKDADDRYSWRTIY